MGVRSVKDADFTIGAGGVDAVRIVGEIRQAVEQKRAQGLYSDPVVARAERWNMAAMQDDDAFLDSYLESLRESVVVDINDFEIVERRTAMAPLLLRLKRTIWKLLKFYTYRLWAQQNTVNGLLLAGIENSERASRRRIAALEARVAALESRRGTPPCQPPTA
jgi:hypothetical protein